MNRSAEWLVSTDFGSQQPKAGSSDHMQQKGLPIICSGDKKNSDSQAQVLANNSQRHKHWTFVGRKSCLTFAQIVENKKFSRGTSSRAD